MSKASLFSECGIGMTLETTPQTNEPSIFKNGEGLRRLTNGQVRSGVYTTQDSIQIR